MNDGGHAGKQRRLEGLSKKTAEHPALRPSPRGGMLYTGGVRGNRGGTGRPITHGRYSQLRHERLRDLIAQHGADPDPLNILPELAAARAMFQDFVDRYQQFSDALIAWHDSYRAGNPDQPARPMQILDIAYAVKIVSEVTRMVKRIEDIRSQDAVSRPELFRILQEMGRGVDMEVKDEAVLARIRDHWAGIRL